MKLTARNTHRDLAYFFLGLIIAFSLSGIFLNHRQVWHPRRYTYNSQEITLKQVVIKDSVNDKFIEAFTKEFAIDDNLRRFSVDGNNLKISYANNDVQVDLTMSKGKIELYCTISVLG